MQTTNQLSALTLMFCIFDHVRCITATVFPFAQFWSVRCRT